MTSFRRLLKKKESAPLLKKLSVLEKRLVPGAEGSKNDRRGPSGGASTKKKSPQKGSKQITQPRKVTKKGPRSQPKNKVDESERDTSGGKRNNSTKLNNLKKKKKSGRTKTKRS